MFLTGAILGSFLLTMVERVRAGATVWGRSVCPECQVVIAPAHLVPLLSWMALGGRCASCKKPIAFRYPLAEIVAASGLLLLFLRFSFLWPGEWWHFLFAACVAVVLFFFAAFDIRFRLVPIELAGGAAIAAFVARGFLDGAWGSSFVGMAAAAGFVLVQVILTRGKGVGSGDPWVAAFLGAAFGWPMVGVVFYVTYVVGGLLLLLAWALGLVRKGERVPLVAMMAGGAFVTLLWGDALLAWAAPFLGW